MHSSSLSNTVLTLQSVHSRVDISKPCLNKRRLQRSRDRTPPSSLLPETVKMAHVMIAMSLGLSLAALAGLVYLWDAKARSRVIGSVRKALKSGKYSTALGNGRASSATSTMSASDKDREFGQWVPDLTFRYPAIQAISGFNIDEVEPIPYRPFRLVCAYRRLRDAIANHALAFCAATQLGSKVSTTGFPARKYAIANIIYSAILSISALERCHGTIGSSWIISK